MIIVAGCLFIDPDQRATYLEQLADVMPMARAAAGCLDFVQVADPVEPNRIVVYERWTSDEDLHAFRRAASGVEGAPELLGAEVVKYRISGVESA